MGSRVKKSKAQESLDEKEEVITRAPAHAALATRARTHSLQVRLMRAIMEFGWGLGAKTGAPDSDEVPPLPPPTAPHELRTQPQICNTLHLPNANL